MVVHTSHPHLILLHLVPASRARSPSLMQRPDQSYSPCRLFRMDKRVCTSHYIPFG